MGKVAIVTGAGQGIGYAIAKRLYKDGFQVGLLDFNKETVEMAAKEISETDTIAVVADVSKRQDVLEAVNKVVEHFGDLSVVVNNAGVGPTDTLETLTEDMVERTFKINVGGTIWVSQAALNQFTKLGHGGKIINASSQAGVAGNAGFEVYSASKFAVRGLTQSWALDLADKGITVNAYAPGIVKTPMVEKVANELAESAGKDLDWALSHMAEGVTLKRLSEPEDVANVVGFLAGPDSDYITGQTIICDGGMAFH